MTKEKVRPIPQLQLGLRQQAHPLHPGQERRRELSPLRHRRRHRRDQGPHADRRRARRDSRSQREVSRTKSSSASTIATRSFTTSGGSTSTRARRSSCKQNPGVAGYLTDDDFNVRLRIELHADRRPGLASCRKAKATASKWKEFLEFGPEDAMTSGPAGFDKTGQTLYFQDSRNRNTAGLFAMDLEIGDIEADRRRPARPTSAACSPIRPKRTSRPSRSPTHARNGRSSTIRSRPTISSS